MARWLALSIAALGTIPGLAPQGDQPTEAQAHQFVRELDRHFNAGAVEDYLARFVNQGSRTFDRQLRSQIESLHLLPGLQAQSRVEAFFRRRDIGVALVATTYTAGTRSFTIHNFIGIARRVGQTVGRFAIEVDPERARSMLAMQGRFACRACNFELCFDDSWLAVPVLPGRSGCMEAVWLVSLTHDLHIEAAVHVGDEALPADQVMNLCLQSPRAKAQMQDPRPDELRYLPWRPGAYAQGLPMPAGMSAVSAVRHCKKGQCARLHLLVMGKLRYLLVVRGTDTGIAANHALVHRVLDSFRLLDPKLTTARLAAQSIHRHTGAGKLSADNRYTNPTYNVDIRGPGSWAASVHPGGWLFQLEYRGPDDRANLNVRAVRPLGTDWTKASVDEAVQDALDRAGRSIATDSGWQGPDATGFTWRELTTIRCGSGSPQAQSGAAQSDHIARYAMRPDMLLILDGSFRDAASRDEIRRAIRSLRTLR